MIRFAHDNCKLCAHYQGERKCKAFPEQIPDQLWQGENLHRDAYIGDKGFRFKLLLRKPFSIQDIGGE